METGIRNFFLVVFNIYYILETVFENISQTRAQFRTESMTCSEILVGKNGSDLLHALSSNAETRSFQRSIPMEACELEQIFWS